MHLPLVLALAALVPLAELVASAADPFGSKEGVQVPLVDTGAGGASPVLGVLAPAKLRTSFNNSLGDRFWVNGKWYFEPTRPASLLGNSFMVQLRSMYHATWNLESAEWLSPCMRYHTGPGRWGMRDVTEIVPYKFRHKLGRGGAHEPSVELDTLDKDVCRHTADGPSHRAQWVCGLLLGHDLIGDFFRNGVGAWAAAAARQVQVPLAGDAVIHFRCGDILGGIRNSWYGVPELSWYAAQVPPEAKRVLIVGNFDSSKSSRVHRPSDLKGAVRCAYFRRQLPLFITARTGKPAFVVDSGGPNRDFIMLAMAPTLIGSISTFSLAAAACNRHGTSVLPTAALFLPCETVMRRVQFPRIKFVPFSHGLHSVLDTPLTKPEGATAEEQARWVFNQLINGRGKWDGFAGTFPQCPGSFRGWIA